MAILNDTLGKIFLHDERIKLCTMISMELRGRGFPESISDYAEISNAIRTSS
jgi:hypothetical protein